MTSTPPRLLGAVLCGGDSTRMGVCKSTLPHPSGQSFLVHAARRLAAICDEVVLSGRTTQTTDYACIDDARPKTGPVAGVAACIAEAQRRDCDACMFTPVDMPDLQPSDLRRLYTAWLASPTKIVCACEAATLKLQPLTAVIPVALRHSLEQLAESKDRSLYRWINAQPHTTVTFTTSTLRNVNTPADRRT